MKQKQYFLAHKEDEAGILTVGMNQEGFSHRLVYDYLKIPALKDHFFIFKNGYLDWFCEKKLWDTILTIVINKIKNDKTFGKKIWDITLEINNKLEKECKKTHKNWLKIISLFHQSYSIGMIPPISDIQHFSFTRLMEQIIAKRIEQLKLNRPIGDYFSVLTAPTKESIFQKSEKELLKITTDRGIENYLKKYSWIEYGHLGPALTATKVKQKLKKLKKSTSKKINLVKDQKRYANELKLAPQEKQIFQTARYFGQHKAHRLAIAYLVNYTINQELKILAKKYGYTLQELRNLTKDEFLEMIKSGKKISKNILQQRQKLCVHYVIVYGKTKVYTDKKARDFIRKYVPEEKIDTSQQMIQGTVACAGKATGKVKIINSSTDMGKMNKNNILVAVQTMPQLLPAMKKAAAFITDIGGITCHAAIVAREMNKPCIIGTWNATKILKDGDLVEVDANKGVVKILKK